MRRLSAQWWANAFYMCLENLVGSEQTLQFDSFGAKFETTFVSRFLFSNKLSIGKNL